MQRRPPASQRALGVVAVADGGGAAVERAAVSEPRTSQRPLALDQRASPSWPSLWDGVAAGAAATTSAAAGVAGEGAAGDDDEALLGLGEPGGPPRDLLALLALAPPCHPTGQASPQAAAARHAAGGGAGSSAAWTQVLTESPVVEHVCQPASRVHDDDPAMPSARARAEAYYARMRAAAVARGGGAAGSSDGSSLLRPARGTQTLAALVRGSHAQATYPQLAEAASQASPHAISDELGAAADGAATAAATRMQHTQQVGASSGGGGAATTMSVRGGVFGAGAPAAPSLHARSPLHVGEAAGGLGSVAAVDADGCSRGDGEGGPAARGGSASTAVGSRRDFQLSTSSPLSSACSWARPSLRSGGGHRSSSLGGGMGVGGWDGTPSTPPTLQEASWDVDAAAAAVASTAARLLAESLAAPDCLVDADAALSFLSPPGSRDGLPSSAAAPHRRRVHDGSGGGAEATTGGGGRTRQAWASSTGVGSLLVSRSSRGRGAADAVMGGVVSFHDGGSSVHSSSSGVSAGGGRASRQRRATTAGMAVLGGRGATSTRAQLCGGGRGGGAGTPATTGGARGAGLHAPPRGSPTHRGDGSSSSSPPSTYSGEGCALDDSVSVGRSTLLGGAEADAPRLRATLAALALAPPPTALGAAARSTSSAACERAMSSPSLAEALLLCERLLLRDRMQWALAAYRAGPGYDLQQLLRCPAPPLAATATPISGDDDSPAAAATPPQLTGYALAAAATAVLAHAQAALAERVATQSDSPEVQEPADSEELAAQPQPPASDELTAGCGPQPLPPPSFTPLWTYRCPATEGLNVSCMAWARPPSAPAVTTTATALAAGGIGDGFNDAAAAASVAVVALEVGAAPPVPPTPGGGAATSATFTVQTPPTPIHERALPPAGVGDATALALAQPIPSAGGVLASHPSGEDTPPPLGGVLPSLSSPYVIEKRDGAGLPPAALHPAPVIPATATTHWPCDLVAVGYGAFSTSPASPSDELAGTGDGDALAAPPATRTGARGGAMGARPASQLCPPLGDGGSPAVAAVAAAERAARARVAACASNPRGCIALWSPASPHAPHALLATPHDVSVCSLAWSRLRPALLAAGLADGRVCVFDARSALAAAVTVGTAGGDSSAPSLVSDALAPGAHRAPVWQVVWAPAADGSGGGSGGGGEEEGEGEVLTSTAGDGQVTAWSIKRGSLAPRTRLQSLKRTPWAADGGAGRDGEGAPPSPTARAAAPPAAPLPAPPPAAVASATAASSGGCGVTDYANGGFDAAHLAGVPGAGTLGLLSRLAGGTCLTFLPGDATRFFVGCDDGTLARCSTSFGERPLEAVQAHRGPVYRVVASPFLPCALLTCGGDGCVRLWNAASLAGRAVPPQRSQPPPPQPQGGSLLFAGGGGAQQDAVVDVAWSPTDSTLFASASRSGTLAVWRARRGGGSRAPLLTMCLRVGPAEWQRLLASELARAAREAARGGGLRRRRDEARVEEGAEDHGGDEEWDDIVGESPVTTMEVTGAAAVGGAAGWRGAAVTRGGGLGYRSSTEGSHRRVPGGRLLAARAPAASATTSRGPALGADVGAEFDSDEEAVRAALAEARDAARRPPPATLARALGGFAVASAPPSSGGVATALDDDTEWLGSDAEADGDPSLSHRPSLLSEDEKVPLPLPPSSSAAAADASAAAAANAAPCSPPPAKPLTCVLFAPSCGGRVLLVGDSAGCVSVLRLTGLDVELAATAQVLLSSVGVAAGGADGATGGSGGGKVVVHATLASGGGGGGSGGGNDADADADGAPGGLVDALAALTQQRGGVQDDDAQLQALAALL